VRFSPLRYAGRILRRAGNQLLKQASLKGIWIDVGAHHGETTLGYASHNPALTIYAFEPNLRAAAKLFGLAPNYVVIPMAVAETDGAAQFHVNSFDQASSLLTMDETARQSWKGDEALNEESVLTVPTIRLDTFLNNMRIPRVDFLKVDTQGNDLSVLRSCGKRLRDIRKITLEVDVSPRRLYQGSPSKEEVLSFLQGSGFTLVSSISQSQGQEENLTFECSSSR
jgi:FkbM family methyltransferase